MDYILPAVALAGIAFVLSVRFWATSLKLVFVLVLAEGALRKWVLPGASDLIYFGKDILLVGVYVGFWTVGPGARKSTRLLPRWFPKLLLLVTLGPIFFLCFNPNTGSLLAAALGARGYLFYLPIIVIVPHLFKTRTDLIRQTSVYALCAIPVCLLAVLQFRSDAFSVVNTYAGGTSEYGASTFGRDSDRVRVTATFSYLSGHVVFVASFFALSIALLPCRGIRYRNIIAFVSLPLILGNVFMSGSRAAFLACALIGTGFAVNLMGAITAKGRRRALRIGIAIGVSVMLISGIVFSEAATSLYGRSRQASDSVKSRLIDQTTLNLSLALDKGGLFGCGIGTTSPAVRSLRRILKLPAPPNDPGHYDLELGQTLAELGMTGFCCWYAFRGLILFALWRGYRRCRDEELRAFVLVTFFLYIPWLMLSLVLNHVACVLFSGMIGLSLAAIRFSAPSISSQPGAAVH